MAEAVIVSSVRTPAGKAYKGSLRATRPDDLAALAIKEALVFPAVHFGVLSAHLVRPNGYHQQ